jgi:drug/metabolite transporter (DMT)-like permease
MGGVWDRILYLLTALAFFTWYEAMNKIELSLLNVMQYLSPIFTIILAMFLLGETVSILNVGGIILVIIGIAFTVVTPQKTIEGWYRLKLRTCVTLKVEK